MHKLFQFRHEYLSFSIKSCYKNPKFLLPISHLHGFSKIQDLDFIFEEVEVLDSSKPTNQKNQLPSKTNEPSDDSHPSERMESTVQISHPWPEWVDLMELLLKRGYFEAGGKPVGNKELGSKDASCIRTACLNFARDRFGLIRYRRLICGWMILPLTFDICFFYLFIYRVVSVPALILSKLIILFCDYCF